MLTVAEAEKWLADSQAKEAAAFEAAVAALQSAMEAKCRTVTAWKMLAEARGGKPDYDNDSVILTSRAQRGCRKIIERALTVTSLDRLGF